MVWIEVESLERVEYTNLAELNTRYSGAVSELNTRYSGAISELNTRYSGAVSELTYHIFRGGFRA